MMHETKSAPPRWYSLDEEVVFDGDGDGGESFPARFIGKLAVGGGATSRTLVDADLHIAIAATVVRLHVRPGESGVEFYGSIEDDRAAQRLGGHVLVLGFIPTITEAELGLCIAGQITWGDLKKAATWVVEELTCWVSLLASDSSRWISAGGGLLAYKLNIAVNASSSVKHTFPPGNVKITDCEYHDTALANTVKMLSYLGGGEKLIGVGTVVATPGGGAIGPASLPASTAGVAGVPTGVAIEQWNHILVRATAEDARGHFGFEWFVFTVPKMPMP